MASVGQAEDYSREKSLTFLKKVLVVRDFKTMMILNLKMFFL